MNLTGKDGFKIVLVGVEFEENLSLRYLAGSLKSSGYASVAVQAYNSLTEAGEIVDFIIHEKVDLIGISMAFQVRAIDDMAIVQLLRKRGYKNHITAGGQFATLHYQEIFDDCSGLNSIIRFEAESAIVELADSLLNSNDLQAVSGLVWKDTNGHVHSNYSTPAPADINDLPLPLRKTDRLEFLGLRNVQMIGSRGCHATCKYCCVSALATERRLSSRASGSATAIPGTRRRTAVNIANEIAALYHRDGLRIFEFQDDNWIHPKISIAVEYFAELKKELEKRGVGKIGLTLKTRADSVQPEIIKILKEIGLIRVFVGIESGTQNLLSKLGRKSRDNVSLQALQVLRDFKIPAYFNALLFGPDINFEEIEPELEFLEKCAEFPFEIVEVVIYGKTGLYQSLKQQKRLRGNYLDYDYDYLDKRTQDTHSIICNLETRHFGVYSPVKMAADLGFNLGILQVFYPGDFTDSIEEKVRSLVRKINFDQVRIIRMAARMASVGEAHNESIETIIAETISTDLQFYKEIIDLHHQMEVHVKDLIKINSVTSYYRVGAIVQSGLIASLFLMLASSAGAQTLTPLNEKLEKDLVEFVQHPDSKKWKTLKDQLKSEKVPVGRYYSKVYLDVDSILSVNDSLDKTEVVDNLDELGKKIHRIRQKKIREDYRRLNKILREHHPKIRIASSARFYLDNEGRVVDVYLASSKNNVSLTPEMKQIILDLLKDKQFYAYEGRGSITNHPKRIKAGKYKRQRRGPMD